MEVRVGRYCFSETDARRTVAEALALLDEYGEHDLLATAALAGRRTRLRERLGAAAGWTAPVDDVARLLPAVWQELTGARSDLEHAGLLPDRTEGAAVFLHLGSGGVPKHPVASIEVELGGLVGDRQATRRHHGAPWQALCLWSEDVIAAFAAGGHPIGPGSAGENITVSGIRWGDVRPGVRLAVGDVLCEISSYAVPCKQNARWFSDGDFNRIHHRHGPVSRMYATVLEPGTITVGDTAIVEP